MFFAVQVPKLMFKKRLKHRHLQCFLFLPSRKQRNLQCFLTLRAPKSSQNIGIYDVLAKTKTASVANYIAKFSAKICPKHMYTGVCPSSRSCIVSCLQKKQLSGDPFLNEPWVWEEE